MNRNLDLSSCILRSWTLYKSEFGLIFFACLVISVATSAASGFPYIGPMLGLTINGVLYGGLYFFFLKIIRGEKAELTDAFEGFRIALLPLILGSLITNVLIIFAALIVLTPALFTLVPLLIEFAQDPELAPNIFIPAITAGTVINIVFCVIVASVLYTLWIFAFPLIIDKRMDVWPAMESSRKAVQANFAAMLGLVLVGVLLAVIGVLGCCIGIFFTMPVFFGAVAYAYEDLFGSDSTPVKI